jgi:hypothetical protein
MKRVVGALSLPGVLVPHHMIFSYSGQSNIKTGRKSANDKDRRLFLSELNITKNGVLCQLESPPCPPSVFTLPPPSSPLNLRRE